MATDNPSSHFTSPDHSSADYTGPDYTTGGATTSTGLSAGPDFVPAGGSSPRLTRATDGRMIGGVCAGIARRYGWDVNLIRVLFVLSCLLPGPQVLAYLALWVIIPSDR